MCESETVSQAAPKSKLAEQFPVGAKVTVPRWDNAEAVVTGVSTLMGDEFVDIKVTAGTRLGNTGGFYPRNVVLISAPTHPLALRGYLVGDKVTVNWPSWNSVGTVNGTNGRFIRVKLEDGRVGGFEPKYLTPVGLIAVQPTAPAPQPTQQAATPVGVRRIAQSIALELGKLNRYVTSDLVQAELIKRGYTAAQLGNAAGSLFQGGLFKRTDKTVKSGRPEAHGRRIFVWEYTGTITPAPAPGIPTKYIVEYRNNRRTNWERSGNWQGSQHRSKSLADVEFNTLAEAQAEAQHQEQTMGGTYEYRATAI